MATSPPSGRRPNDTWDAFHGVGETALAMASARARESLAVQPLFRDPLATALIDTACARGWNPSFSSAGNGPATVDPRAAALFNYAACRTKHFDEFFDAAVGAGIQQFVILGSGLDLRPWRLRWALDAVVYEIDQPQVLDFKLDVAAQCGMPLPCAHRPLGVDLRHDWPAALLELGFDRAQPSAWSVEGLLAYIPPDGQTVLFDRLTELCSRGSRISVEGDAAAGLSEEATERRRAELRDLKHEDTQAGNSFLAGVGSLWYPGDRPYLGAWLSQHGWDVSTLGAADLLDRYNRGADRAAATILPRSEFLEARRTQ